MYLLLFSQAAIQVPEDSSRPLNPSQRGNRQIQFNFYHMLVVGANKTQFFFPSVCFPSCVGRSGSQAGPPQKAHDGAKDSGQESQMEEDCALHPDSDSDTWHSSHCRLLQ